MGNTGGGRSRDSLGDYTMTMRQFEPVSGRFLGTPPNTDEQYVSWCPDCGRRLVDGQEGYGLTYGGGIGHYIFCSNRHCNWFYKMLDSDETEPDRVQNLE